MGYITGPVQHGLFTVDPMPELEEDLLRTFAGRTLSVGTIFNQHHVTSDRYILKNYQEALRRLEARTAIHATPSSEERQSRNGIVTMSETVDITFPKRQEGV